MTLDIDKFNNQSTGEEVANAITHGIGALLATWGAVLLILKAVQQGQQIDIVSFSIYGASMIELYLVSCVYHAISNQKAKKVMQIMDHCSVFLLILGTYTPICLSFLGGVAGLTVFVINAIFTILGITLNAIDIKRWHKASLICYLVMGWSILFVIKPMIEKMTWQSFLLLLAGGISYSVGVLFYKAKSPKFMHTVWHLFVLVGSILHFAFVYFYAI